MAYFRSFHLFSVSQTAELQADSGSCKRHPPPSTEFAERQRVCRVSAIEEIA